MSSTTTVFAGGEIVTPTAVLPGGWVVVRDGVIAAIGTAGGEGYDAVSGAPAGLDDATVVQLHGRRLCPGFVDLHVHGAAGGSFDAGAEGIDTGLAAHRRHGTTRSLVSLVTAPLEVMRKRIRTTTDHVAGDPQVLGLHLEGPFLSELRRGVHDPAALVTPEPGRLNALLDAGAGSVAMVTLAPELEHGADAVRRVVEAGIVAAVGHSDADYDCAAAAFAAGATVVTHAFNGMRPLHHRDPAIIGAAMDAPGVTLEAINDGIHLHPATVRLLRSIAPGRLALVTDAMAAACHGDGDYSLAGFDVLVRDGVARLATSDGTPGSIAGSTLTLDVAVQRAVSSVGMDLVDAVNAASLVPARVLGVHERFGSIEVGKVADLVVTDRSGAVEAVLVAGAWSDERRP
ncbi:MAG: N-acetylglucosamine-6-phosphate deacetylase [Williamsia herbipolensis]|nr:N-acetylglucosamine-6-phosphate deacetylase [Williamsia herbipolensis]